MIIFIKELIKRISYSLAPFIIPKKYLVTNPVFCFHRVLPPNKYIKLNKTQKEFTVTTDFFNNFIELMQSSGYKSASLGEVIYDTQPSEKKFHITFDDGYKDNLTYAEPILSKNNVHATFYITTSVLETKNTNSIPNGSLADRIDDYLCVDDLITLKNLSSKYSFGGHSHNHKNLAKIDDPDDLVNEIKLPKKILENTLGIEIIDFAYPFGGKEEFNSQIIEIVRSENYQTAVTALPYYDKRYAREFSYPRFFVTQRCDQLSLFSRINGLSRILKRQFLK